MNATEGSTKGRKPRQDPTEREIRSLKYFPKLLALFERLHDVGCQRDTAGNRKIFFDQYCALVMLYLLNPLIASMRCLQSSVGLPKVAKTLQVPRFSLGSFSEAPAVFEPDLLHGIINELAAEARPLSLDRTRAHCQQIQDLKHALTLVDGTMLAALPRLAQAAALGTRYASARDGKDLYAWRLHTQLELGLDYPLGIQVTGANKAGENREVQVLRRSLQSGRCYVTDAAYADGRLFDEIVEIDSSYVCRVRENLGVLQHDDSDRILAERELSSEALAAGIVRDVIVSFPGSKHPVRILVLQVTPQRRRSRKALREGGAQVVGTHYSDVLVIATSLLDLPAELVAFIYRQRYSVELFFRFLKSLLGMRHLLSQNDKGVQIQTYCAIIACLLLSLQTGRRPNKRMVEMLGWYLAGMASEQDVIDFLNKPDNTGVKRRAKDELWKKLGVN